MRNQSNNASIFETLEGRALLSTYYVTTGGANGNSGSSANPWRTLQYAADRVVAGDTVIVAAGNYVGFDLRTSGTANARITFKAQSGVVINQVNTETNKDGINIENASYITIDGFTLIGTGNPATSRAGIRVVGDGYGYDDGAFSQGVIVQNNVADRWGVWGILTGFCDDMIIQNNTTSRSAQQHGIYFSNSGDRPIIRNNTSWGNANCGIHINADIETGNTNIPAVDGIITGALIDGNTVYDNGAGSAFGGPGGSAINADGVRNSRFVNNVLYNNHAGGIALYQIDAAAPAVGNTVANNTVIQAADGRWCLLVTDGAINTTVFNNIFYNLHGYRGSIDLSADSTAGFKSDYNLFDGKLGHAGSVGNLTTWRSLTGGDSHSASLSLAQMQALFANYSGNNFALAVGSAAIDGGTSAMVNGGTNPAPTNDRALPGARPAGDAWDIGAYEFTGAAAASFATLTNGKLRVNGTSGNDSISVLRLGASIVVYRNGVDMTFASELIDSIEVHANDGNDIVAIAASVMGTYVNAGSGNDFVQGSDARDTISGGAGKDRIFGGGGDDLLCGNQASDSLYGESGKDRIYGHDGDDSLDGGTHDDRIWGDAGQNYFSGGAGNDTLYARYNSADILNGGAGTDAAQVDPLDQMMDLVETVMT